jgi:hypothetical protein
VSGGEVDIETRLSGIRFTSTFDPTEGASGAVGNSGSPASMTTPFESAVIVMLNDWDSEVSLLFLLSLLFEFDAVEDVEVSDRAEAFALEADEIEGKKHRAVNTRAITVGDIIAE